MTAVMDGGIVNSPPLETTWVWESNWVWELGSGPGRHCRTVCVIVLLLWFLYLTLSGQSGDLPIRLATLGPA